MTSMWPGCMILKGTYAEDFDPRVATLGSGIFRRWSRVGTYVLMEDVGPGKCPHSVSCQ